jgi:hypothetical protein
MKSTRERPMSASHHSAGSHGVRRHTRNKKSDPFLELSNEKITTAAEQPNPRSPNGEHGRDEQRGSLLVDVREYLAYAGMECVADRGSSSSLP